MKRGSLIAMVMLFAVVTQAQNYDPHKAKSIPDKFIEIPIFILGVYLAATFILKIIKMILDNRLKYKLLEKGDSADVIKELLISAPMDIRNEVMKLTTLFIGTCVGFGISYFFQPFGNHTVVIMAGSIAVSILVYYHFIYRSPH